MIRLEKRLKRIKEQKSSKLRLNRFSREFVKNRSPDAVDQESDSRRFSVLSRVDCRTIRTNTATYRKLRTVYA